MKISSIAISNFKQFFGEQQVEISTEETRNVTVFHGLNGTGKTSLFTAINWCLFGEGHEGMGDLLNRQVLADSDIGETITMRVRIEFVHETHRYIAERQLDFIKIDRNAIEHYKEFNLYAIDTKGQTERVPNPEGQMDSILPRNIREYFFFNGEKMEDLTRPGNQKIQDAIKNIMHLPIIDRAVTHLEAATKDFQSEISRLGKGQVDDLIKLQNAKEEEKKRLERRNAELEHEITAAEVQLIDLENELNDHKAVGQLQQLRKIVQEDLLKLAVDRDQLEGKTRKTANECFPLLSFSTSKKALELINTQIGKGKIPSGIREQFIRELLAQGNCICERSLTLGTPEYASLVNLLRVTASSSVEEKILTLRGQISTLSRISNKNFEILKDLVQSYNMVIRSIEVKTREEDDITRRIGSSEEIDVVALETSVRKFRNDITSYRIEIAKNNDKVKLLDSEILDVKKRRQEEEKKQSALVRLSAKEALAERATVAMREIKEKFYEATRCRIEEETKLAFTNLAWKTDQFHDLQLDKDFHLEILDRWNLPSRAILSAGERQMLSLAFITALSRLSGEEAPVAMDTPFARLSGNHMSTASRNLPELLPQLILFVTDTEWTEQVVCGLHDRIGKQYTFDFVGGSTTIREEKNG